MTTYWEKAPIEVIQLAEALIAAHHRDLLDARIGILFRSPTPESKGKRQLGEASKVTDKIRPLLKRDLDFIIWVAADWWLDEADERQKKAMLDHTLCHCRIVDGVPTIAQHDIEEFTQVIHRYGFWNEDLERFDQDGRQARLFAPAGEVLAVDTDLAGEFMT